MIKELIVHHSKIGLPMVGSSGRAPALPAGKAGKGRQRRGLRLVTQAQAASTCGSSPNRNWHLGCEWVVHLVGARNSRNGCYGIFGPGSRGSLRLDVGARITLPHFSVSSAISWPKSAGEPASTLPPRSSIRDLI